MIANGIISNIMFITERVALHNLKGFCGLFPLGLYLSF